MHKDGSPKDYRLAQAADLICTLELTAFKFKTNEHARPTMASSVRSATPKRTT